MEIPFWKRLLSLTEPPSEKIVGDEEDLLGGEEGACEEGSLDHVYDDDS